MQSISEAAAHLQVGKSRLWALLKNHRIKPSKNGRHKELSNDLVEQLFQITAAGGPTTARKPEAGTAPSSSGSHQPAEDPTAMLLVERLRSQNQVLLKQLPHEQDERKAERQERKNYQQMLAALQQNNHATPGEKSPAV